MKITTHIIIVFLMLIYTAFYINFVLYDFFTFSLLGGLQFYIFAVWIILMLTDPGSPSENEKKIINHIFDHIESDATPEPEDKILYNFFNENRWGYYQKQGLIKGYRHCKICNSVKLPRMHHSSLLNKCVYRMDHHCLLVNNCIGYRNYHIFIQFTILTLLVFLYIKNDSKRKQYC